MKGGSEKHCSTKHEGCLSRCLDPVSCDCDEKTVDSCIFAVISQFDKLIHCLGDKGVRPSEWQPVDGKCFFLCVCDFTGFSFFEGGADLTTLAKSFDAGASISFWSEGHQILHDTLIDNHARIIVIPGDDSIEFPLNDEQLNESKCATVKPPSVPLGSHSKTWKKGESERFKVSHKGVEQMMTDYRFSTIEELQGAWGAQPVNVKVRLFQCVCKTENLDLWKVQVDNSIDKGSTDVWCFIASKWNDLFLLEKDNHLAFFGAGLIGFYGNTVTLMNFVYDQSF